MTRPDDDDRTTRHDTSHLDSTTGGDPSPYRGGASPYRGGSDDHGDSHRDSRGGADGADATQSYRSGGDLPSYTGGSDTSSPYSSSAAADTTSYRSPYDAPGTSPGDDTTTRTDQQQPWSFDDTYGSGAGGDRAATVARPSDRLWPHLVWELVLVGGVVLGVVLVLLAGPTEALIGVGRTAVLSQLAIVGFVATGFALSLRAATPNLAVGGVAGLAATLVAWLTAEQDWNVLLAGLGVVVAAAVAGLVLAVVVVGLHVPSWAVTLGAGALFPVLALGLTDSNVIQLPGDDYRWPWAWAILFVVVSIGGGLLCATRGFRSFIGSPRRLDDDPLDPASRPGGRAATAATIALVGSTVLAAIGGIVMVLWQRAVVPTDGGGLLIGAVAIALLGGVSAFGRRGGIAGVVLATATFVLVRYAMTLEGLESWLTATVPAGGALIVGLVATRFIEVANRRRATA